MQFLHIVETDIYSQLVSIIKFAYNTKNNKLLYILKVQYSFLEI